jgi:hypothetical protein
MYEKIELIISEYKLNIITKEKCLIELRNHIEQIIKQVDAKQLTLTDVSQQRELLNAFIEHYNERVYGDKRICNDEVDIYLDSI